MHGELGYLRLSKKCGNGTTPSIPIITDHDIRNKDFVCDGGGGGCLAGPLS